MTRGMVVVVAEWILIVAAKEPFFGRRHVITLQNVAPPKKWWRGGLGTSPDGWLDATTFQLILAGESNCRGEFGTSGTCVITRVAGRKIEREKKPGIRGAASDLDPFLSLTQPTNPLLGPSEKNHWHTSRDWFVQGGRAAQPETTPRNQPSPICV